MGWRFILSLGFSIVIALFAIANAAAVRVNFIFAIYEVSQAVVILLSAIVGAVIVMLLSIVKNIKLNMKINSQDKAITELQKDKEKKAAQFADLEKKYEELFSEENLAVGDEVVLLPDEVVVVEQAKEISRTD